MNLLFRLGWVVLRALAYRRGSFPPLAEARLAFRVLPNDLDFNLHMNNARYLSLMDLGRVDLLNHLGLLRLAFRGRWFPVLGTVTIRYHRPLKLFDRFDLITRILGWDEKWFYLEQRFEREGKPIATARAAGLLRRAEGSIPTGEVLGMLEIEMQSPEMSEEVEKLME